MKIPSFLKVPSHQRFRFDPRYYDPVKEEVEQRVSRIRKEISDTVSVDDNYKQRISSSYQRRTYDRRTPARSGLQQFMIMIILFEGFIGYIFLGNIALYVLLLLIVLYAYLRLRRII